MPTRALTRIILTPMSHQTSHLADAIRSKAVELGFQQLGFTDVDLTHHEPHVRFVVSQVHIGEAQLLEAELNRFAADSIGQV